MISVILGQRMRYSIWRIALGNSRVLPFTMQIDVV
jgi:hypothetical protein